MRMPERCPKCDHAMSIWGDGIPTYFLQRAEPDFDKDDPDRIMDSIEECSNCHTLFRFRWKLETIHVLVEKEL